MIFRSTFGWVVENILLAGLDEVLRRKVISSYFACGIKPLGEFDTNTSGYFGSAGIIGTRFQTLQKCINVQRVPKVEQPLAGEQPLAVEQPLAGE